MIHANRDGVKTDITLVGKYLTFSRIVDSKLATINKIIDVDTPTSRFIRIVTNVCEFSNDIFVMASSSLEPDEL